jgi:hypothetical protein
MSEGGHFSRLRFNTLALLHLPNIEDPALVAGLGRVDHTPWSLMQYSSPDAVG